MCSMIVAKWSIMILMRIILRSCFKMTRRGRSFSMYSPMRLKRWRVWKWVDGITKNNIKSNSANLKYPQIEGSLSANSLNSSWNSSPHRQTPISAHTARLTNKIKNTQFYQCSRSTKKISNNFNKSTLKSCIIWLKSAWFKSKKRLNMISSNFTVRSCSMCWAWLLGTVRRELRSYWKRKNKN